MLQSLPMFALEPPYVLARRLGELAPALGAVLLLDAHDALLTTNEVKQAMGRAPWCPVCLLASRDSSMRAVRRLGRTCVVFGLDEGAAGILRAVEARPRPSAQDLGEWIARRARLTGICRYLTDVALRPDVRVDAERFLSAPERECLRRLGDWSPRQWQQALRLAEIASDRHALRHFMSSSAQHDAALRAEIPALLGVTQQQYEEYVGWEWVLELSLRQSGFFERARGIQRLVPHPYSTWSAPVEASFSATA